MASRTRRPDPRRLALLGVALGVATIALAFAPSLAVAWILLPPLGAAAIAFAITGNSTLQLTSSPEMRGRVMALYTVVFLGSTPIAGPIPRWSGPHPRPPVRPYPRWGRAAAVPRRRGSHRVHRPGWPDHRTCHPPTTGARARRRTTRPPHRSPARARNGRSRGSTCRTGARAEAPCGCPFCGTLRTDLAERS